MQVQRDVRNDRSKRQVTSPSAISTCVSSATPRGYEDRTGTVGP
jgi:hypothetical protein